MYELDLGKAEEPEIKTANIRWIIKKTRAFQKKHLLLLNDDAKAFDCVDHNKMWKILKEMGIPDLTCFLRNLFAGQEVTVKPDMYPCFQQGELFQYCLDNGVQPIGYSPLGSPARPERDKIGRAHV